MALSLAACARPDAPTGAAASTGSPGSSAQTSATVGAPDDAAVETLRIAPPPDAGAKAVAAATPVPTIATSPAGDDALDPTLFACHADADCTAVKKNGCCNHGELEAVAASQVAAYKASFTCHTHVMCPQYLRRDLRVPVCDTAASRCRMVQPGAGSAAP